MAAKAESAGERSADGDVGAQVGRTLEAAVTRPPGRQELTWNAVLAGAALVGLVSPPAAIVGVGVNRLIHAAR
jgi:hypothetical protein